MAQTTIEQLRAWARLQSLAVLVRPDGTMATAPEGDAWTAWQASALIELVNSEAPATSDAGRVLHAQGYELLAGVLAEAFGQAAFGKGRERHACGEPFHHQVMAEGANRFGVGALLFQAFKKSEESQRLPYPRSRAELLGAIVYLAGAVIHLDRHQPQAANDGLAETKGLQANG